MICRPFWAFRADVVDWKCYLSCTERHFRCWMYLDDVNQIAAMSDGCLAALLVPTKRTEQTARVLKCLNGCHSSKTFRFTATSTTVTQSMSILYLCSSWSRVTSMIKHSSRLHTSSAQQTYQRWIKTIEREHESPKMSWTDEKRAEAVRKLPLIASHITEA